jgi:hypothetical protein
MVHFLAEYNYSILLNELRRITKSSVSVAPPKSELSYHCTTLVDAYRLNLPRKLRLCFSNFETKCPIQTKVMTTVCQFHVCRGCYRQPALWRHIFSVSGSECDISLAIMNPSVLTVIVK